MHRQRRALTKMGFLKCICMPKPQASSFCFPNPYMHGFNVYHTPLWLLLACYVFVLRRGYEWKDGPKFSSGFMQFKKAFKTPKGILLTTEENAKARECHWLPLQVFSGKSLSSLFVYCIVSRLSHFPEPGTFSEADTKLVTSIRVLNFATVCLRCLNSSKMS